jgi:predicted O-methyltransferase YrrM
VIFKGEPEQIISNVEAEHPEVRDVLRAAQTVVTRMKGQIHEYQAAVLYGLANQFNRQRTCILEIGTLAGYSSFIFAMAAPLANIVTLNPSASEAAIARKALARFDNVTVTEIKSWDLLETYAGPPLDMVFVDGDHNRIALDMPWWNWLTVGGLMVWHDYAPVGTPRPCLPVFDAVNAWAARLGRGLDVLVVDDKGVGLAGLYRREGEVWG